MSPNNQTTFRVYSSHSLNIDANKSIVSSCGSEYKFLFSKIADEKLSADYYIITDELCQTNLPFFFPRKRRVALLLESPIYNKAIPLLLLQKRFELILTHREDLVSTGHPFLRLDFSTNLIGWSPSMSNKMGDKEKLVSFIGSISHNSPLRGYSLRKEIVSKLIERDNIDCFGKGIKPVASKLSALERYCFSIAMENTKENYYFSEKIIDCILTKTVPIYWGCPAIGEIFDKRGMLCFSDLESLDEILQRISFEEYEKMKPYIESNKKICLDLLLDSFDSFLIRCARLVESSMSTQVEPDRTFCLSKAAAGYRKFLLDC